MCSTRGPRSVVDIAPPAVYNSYRRSIEHTFDGSSGAEQMGRTWHGRQAAPRQQVRRPRRGDPGRRRPAVIAVALFLVLAFALVSLSSALHSATQAGTAPAASATRFVTVQPGQTLWQIALRVAPRDDPRDTVDRIRSLNDLDTAAVLPGQRLVVPA